jgi:hypothetical protein
MNSLNTPPTMYTNGQFMTYSDDGQLKPIHEILKIEAGRDFEKCARSNTIFHYSGHSAGFETHTSFWSGRKFDVLLVSAKDYANAVWVRGAVVEWTEFNMGPGDRFMKWNLMAEIQQETLSMGCGSLVYHPDKEESRDE